mmetsp:Transcript_33379/g.32443  ORF Transcript_33379/g.32443 Transcript_33379/m.32443 type:complete len:86 (+) Transcript_33379:86-343(+)
MSVVGTPTSFIKKPVAQKSPYLKEVTNTPCTSKFAMEASIFSTDANKSSLERNQNQRGSIGFQGKELDFRPMLDSSKENQENGNK